MFQRRRIDSSFCPHRQITSLLVLPTLLSFVSDLTEHQTNDNTDLMQKMLLITSDSSDGSDDSFPYVFALSVLNDEFLSNGWKVVEMTPVDQRGDLAWVVIEKEDD